MGGTELHSAELAKCLSSAMAVEVVTHCETTAQPDRTLNFDVLKTSDTRRQFENIVVNRVGLSVVDSALVRWVAKHHPTHRFARAIFATLYNLILRRRLASTLKDTSLVHFIYNGLTDAAMHAYKSTRRLNIPFVLTPNVLDTSDADTAWNSRRFQYLYRNADLIIALTSHEADYLIRQGANPARVTVIPYGPVLKESGNAERGRDYLKLGNQRVLLFLGRVVEQKGYKLLLDAYEQIRAGYPDTVLVFMGPASESVKAQLHHEQHHHVYHIDSSDQQIKADILAAAELVCVPSTAESLGVVYLEAFASGKPVVALDLPVLQDVISDKIDGFLVEPVVSSIEEAICKLLEDPAMARRMGQAGYQKVNCQYTWGSVVNKVLSVYTRALVTSEKSQPGNQNRPLAVRAFDQFRLR